MTEKIIYNPMSKEFQDECKRLGLTGNQLTAKYRRKGNYIEKGIYKGGTGKIKEYTDEQLLWYLIQFYERYGRPPTARDFRNNFEYPSSETYRQRFGSFQKALKLVGLDIESMVKNGIVETSNQKGRFGEIIIRDHFKQYPIDLAGENHGSAYDGICPNGKTYEVKSSKLYYKTYYQFSTHNMYKEDIEVYYFLAFNDEDHKKFDYGWRVPGEIVEGNVFIVGLNNGHEFNIENMQKYNITKTLREVLTKYGFFK